MNGEQFRQLVLGEVVHLGCCEIQLGELGFELLEVAEVDKQDVIPEKRLHLVKGPK